MRLNYYRFPEGVDPQTMYLNGADGTCFTCDVDADRWEALAQPWAACLHQNGDWRCLNCSHQVCTEADNTVSGISVTRAKQLLREFGGAAWTSHIDRDGGVFETTPILPGKNNSRFKYNQHL